MTEQSPRIPKTPANLPDRSSGSRKWWIAAGVAIAIAAYIAYVRITAEQPSPVAAERGSALDSEPLPQTNSAAKQTSAPVEAAAESANRPSIGNASPKNAVPATAVVTNDAVDPGAVESVPAAGLGSTEALPAAPHHTAETPPQRDGWESESFNERTDKQLKLLAGLVAAAKPVESAALETLATDDVTATPLHAENLVDVFHDATFHVRRAQGTTGATHRGRSGLADAINGLIASLGDDPQVHAKFKTVSVELADDGATTTMVVQIGGPTRSGTAAGSVQWNSQCRCTWTRPADQSPPLLRSIAASDFEQIVASSPNGGLFADCTAAVLGGNASFAAQLLFGTDHWTGNLDVRTGVDVGGWQGLAIGDANGDGRDDIYVCQPGGLPNRLYVQNPDGTATDNSSLAGVDLVDASHAALFADFDNDGDQDLAVAVWEGVAFFANDGRGRFAPAATVLLPASFSYSLAAADYDLDGDLDLFVCGYNPRPGVDRHILFARPVPYHDANNGGRSAMLRNDGPATTSKRQNDRWRFHQVTTEVGLDENNRRFSYAAAWNDYDDDGDADLFVANDFGRDNLYRNDGGKFHDVAVEAGVDDVGPGMSACWGDYDNDGRADLYVSNMFSSAGNRITRQAQFHAEADAKTLAELRHHARGNSLYRNLGGGKFRDVSLDAAVTLGRWAWGSKFVDLNNDGWEDIYVANGFITQEDTGDL
ncbi:MAG: FG-GAP-like repeat-containing protein [Pirellulales bacterium]